MSQPPNTRSFRSLSGTNFLISGERASVRFPSRIVLSCVSEPTGCALPLRTNSTPAIKVVLTAPIPGSSTPNLPLGGAIFPGFSIPLLLEPGSLLCSTDQLGLPSKKVSTQLQRGPTLAPSLRRKLAPSKPV